MGGEGEEGRKALPNFTKGGGFQGREKVAMSKKRYCGEKEREGASQSSLTVKGENERGGLNLPLSLVRPKGGDKIRKGKLGEKGGRRGGGEEGIPLSGDKKGESHPSVQPLSKRKGDRKEEGEVDVQTIFISLRKEKRRQANPNPFSESRRGPCGGSGGKRKKKEEEKGEKKTKEE